MRRVSMSVLGLLLIASSARAQTTAAGSIRGTVVDEQGAPMPGVSITARSPTVPGEFIATTGLDGQYRLGDLPPGDYTMVAELTGTSVVRDRPFDHQPRLAQAVRRLVRRLAVLSGARHRRELTAALRALGGARGTRDASRIIADAIAGGLQASIVRVLVRRGDDFVDCLGSALIAPRTAAFVTMLRASAQPLNLSANGTMYGRLPEREREWLVTAAVHMAAPILTRDGALAAIVVAGDRDRPINLERRDLWFVEAVSAAASASWIDAGATSLQDRSPTTAEPAFECRQCGAIHQSMPMPCNCGSSPRIAALPARLGGFLAVRRRLGSGGMGVVYLGRDLQLDRDVALKTLPAIAPNAIARLRREARAMASLNHDALATIYGLELWRDVPVLVCEYFPNGTLADRLTRTGPLSPVEAARLGARLARGLEYMHASGVVHGDIKPANIGFTARNDATLLDFGLTRLAADGLADGLHHPVGGTFAYLSPEALRGEPSSPSLDLWALAMVLVECLEGRNPVARGNDVLTRAAIAAVDPVGLTASIRAIDPRLAAILTRALGPSDARFPSAAAIADALEGRGFSERR